MPIDCPGWESNPHDPYGSQDIKSGARIVQPEKGKRVTENTPSAGAQIGAHPTPKTAPMPPDLLAVAQAWPTLPAALRAGIVAMVKAAGTERR